METIGAEKKFRFLVVDDNDDQCGILEKIVTSMGYHCDTVEDGQKAAEYLSNYPCDIVITDMAMPNMNGMELLRHIKGKFPDTSVIVFTGYCKDFTFKDVIDAGAVDFIEKPASRDALMAKINRVVNEKVLVNSCRAEIKTHQVLIDLLNLSIEHKALEELLCEFIVCITNFPWLELEPKGVVFLVDEKDSRILNLKASHNLGEPLRKICASVPFGCCLCGRAAMAEKVIFADHVDNSHENKFEGMSDHGHYCVPIVLSSNKLLGVFSLYTKSGAKRNDKVVTVLKAAAKTLARIISHKQDEDAIAQQEQRFRAITDNALDAIVMINNQGLVSFWNPAAEKFFGYTSEEVLGQNLHDIISPEKFRPRYLPALKEFFSSGQGNAIGKTIEVSALHKNGKEFPAELSLSALNVQGVWQAIGVVRDISERKELALEKEKLNQQLRQAHKMEAIGTLAGGIAHDFNNILGAIIGFAEMGMEDVSAESQIHKDLDRILAAGNRAKELVSQILTFSRQKEEEFIPVKVQILLKEALKMLRASISANIEIRQKIDPKCNSILADPTQIHQVIMNICTNAYYAMRKEGGVLGIDLEEVNIGGDGSANTIELKNGPYIRMTVSDTGPGMDNQVLERIFEPFYTTKPQGEGTGMGLSLVHGIIGDLGGRIDVKSELGKGSVFEIYIPTFFEFEEGLPPKTGPIAGGTERILLVDDELSLIEVSSRRLKKWGYEVTARTSSVEALEAFRTQPDKFDLVITDLAMPNMTGLDLSLEMLKLKPDLPIILSTGFVDAITAEHALKIGIKKIVNKPVSFQEIATVIRKILPGSLV